MFPPRQRRIPIIANDTENPQESKDRMMRIEGWIMIALIGIVGSLSMYVLDGISDDVKDISAELKQIQGNFSSLHEQVALLTDNLSNVTDRLQRDERHIKGTP